MAHDTISFTWQRYNSASKRIKIIVPVGEKFTIDWGNGTNLDTITGTGNWTSISYTYPSGSFYSVTIMGITPNCFFTALDLRHPSSMPTDRNYVTELDLSACLSIQTLDCSKNSLSSLDLSNNVALTILNCSQNQLNSLNVNNNAVLIELNCSANQLSTLNLSNNVVLVELLCSANQLSSLDLSNNTALTRLGCGNNPLYSLDVGSNTALTELGCNSSRLSNLDLSNNVALMYLYCVDNQLTSLCVNNNTALTYLDCGVNQLESLDLSSNAALTYLACDINFLNSVNVSNNISLTYLNVQRNRLESLNLENNTALTDLNCHENQLQLSNLYEISTMPNISVRCLGTQTLLMQEVEIGESIDYFDQNEFEGILTVFTVTKDGAPAFEYDYTLLNGIITFYTSGSYQIVMKNSVIISDSQCPVSVIANITVLLPNSDATLATLQVSEGELHPEFNSHILNYEVNVEHHVEEITIMATPARPKATVTGAGTFSLDFGENIFSITVLAEDTITELVYTVNVNRMLTVQEIAEAFKVIVYPNPAIGELTITNYALRITCVEILGVDGKTLNNYQFSIVNSPLKIDISHLQAGIYFIKITTEQGDVIKKIVKQ